MDMELEFQEGFDLFERESITSEPEWVQLNRQWTLDHPSVLVHKCPKSFLDGWITCEESSKSDLNWNSSFFTQDSKSKKCFIDKIDIKSLVDDPDSFDIDSLFAETDDHSTSNESKMRKWDPSDERKLLRLINSQGKFNMEMWKRLASELGRTVNSVRIKAAQLRKNLGKGSENNKKPSLNQMIYQAIINLPEHQGTKFEIIEKIQHMYGNVSLKRWKTSVKQLLNQHFVKSPGVYRLEEGTIAKDFKKCASMSDYIVWVLAKYGPMNRGDIKQKIQEHFGGDLTESKAQGNLKTWELTFLKKIKGCKYVDSRSAKTTFKIS